jgi:chromosome segregation ATPase
VQRKQGLFFYSVCWLACGLYMGCHSGPVYTDDSAYRAIERESQRRDTELAVTGSNIAAGVDQIDRQAGRIVEELSDVETAISGSSLGEAEKNALLRQVSVAQAEAGELTEQVTSTRADVEQLNVQLAQQREINTELSAEHNRREAAAAVIMGELVDTREKLVRVSGQRNVAMVITVALALAIIGFIVIRVLRFLRIIPV